MDTNIIQLYPTNTPQPPRPTFSFVLRMLRRILAYWKSAMAVEYRGLLPAIIPAHWSVERVLHFANGGKHEPVFIAPISNRVVVRRNRMSEWRLVA